MRLSQFLTSFSENKKTAKFQNFAIVLLLKNTEKLFILKSYKLYFQT